MFRVLWENRNNLPYARRILNHGVCDGCSLGPRGLRDDTLDGVRLCLTRLRLLRYRLLVGAEIVATGSAPFRRALAAVLDGLPFLFQERDASAERVSRTTMPS